MSKAFLIYLVASIVVMVIMGLIMPIVIMGADSQNGELRGQVELLQKKLDFIIDKEERKSIARDDILEQIEKALRFKGSVEKIRGYINDWKVIKNYEKIKVRKTKTLGGGINVYAYMSDVR